MHEVLHTLVQQRAFAHIHVGSHLVADTPDKYTGMIAVAPDCSAEVVSPPGAVRQESFPFVECLIEHQKAQAVREVEYFRRMGVVTQADGIHADRLQYFQSPLDSTLEHPVPSAPRSSCRHTPLMTTRFPVIINPLFTSKRTVRMPNGVS